MTLTFSSLAHQTTTEPPTANRFTKVRGWVLDVLLLADTPMGCGDVIEAVEDAHPTACCALTRDAVDSLVADGTLWREGYLVGLVD